VPAGLRADDSKENRADDWPQWLGPTRDGVWRETGILEKFPKGGPKVLWRTPIGQGYTGPAVAGGRVYVMDRQGDKLKPGAESPGKDGLKSTERVLCLDAKTGKVIWKDEYDATYKVYYPSGPRTTPAVYKGKVYTLGTMGDLRCYDAARGKLLWKKNFPEDYKVKPPIWGWSGHLLVDENAVYSLMGGEGSAAIAFDKDTGKELWKNLTVKEIGYAPPMMFTIGGKKQLIIWHTEALNGLDPKTGKKLWSVPWPDKNDVQRPAIVVGAPKMVGDRLYVSAPYDGSLMVEFEKGKEKPKVAWHDKTNNLAKPDGLHCLMGTPVLTKDHVYGICAFGELRCLDSKDGKRVWESYKPVTGKKTFYGTAFLVQQGGRYFIFNEKGDLVIAKLTPKGYEEIDRAHLLQPTLVSRGRDVVWSHPAFANRCAYVRNDKEIICVSLAK
jgi:outer membrane protein assembly factor BamB